VSWNVTKDGAEGSERAAELSTKIQKCLENGTKTSESLTELPLVV
jgi:hypothetical protein